MNPTTANKTKNTQTFSPAELFNRANKAKAGKNTNKTSGALDRYLGIIDGVTESYVLGYN